MNIWDVCIRRPVFTSMLVAAPVVLGLASYLRLGVELFPNVDVPVITITTILRGASAEEIETSVTKPIEEIVNTVAGIDELRSTSKEGQSQVIVQFYVSKDGDVAAQEVEAKIRTIIGTFPVGTEAPVVDKFAVDAAPILTLGVSGRRDPREVTELARKRLKENLESVTGVGAVNLVGGRQRAIQIVVDPDRLQKYTDLTVEDVRLALIQENREDPGGRMDRGQTERITRTMGRIPDVPQFADLILTNRDGQPIRLRDVGRASDGAEEPRGLSRLWLRDRMPLDVPGATAVSLVIQKQSGANTVAVVDAVRQRLAELKPSLPADIQTEVIRDQSRFIRTSMEEAKVHLFLAAILVAGSVLLFLNDWRTTVIAILAIPTSMIGTFAVMDIMGFTINNFTIIGMILAIGIVVDDAVVVLENIYRHLEEYGANPVEAAQRGTGEIALAVSATTLSLVVIFAPIAFMGGQIGRFFNCFGYVVGVSVMFSLFVSFTLTPMLCARMLQRGQAMHSSKANWLWNSIEHTYMAILRWSMQRRLWVSALSLLVVFSTPLLFGIVGKGFVAKDDQSEFEIALTLPEGYTLSRADELLNEVDLRLRRLRGVRLTYITIGDTSGRAAKGQGDVTRATIYVRIDELGTRPYSQVEIMQDARAILADYQELRASVQHVPAISGAAFRAVDIDLNLSGPDIERLQQYSSTITDWMRIQPGFVDVDVSLTLRKPELHVIPNRERMNDLGVSLESISNTVNVLVGGVPVTKYKEAAEQYDVWLRAEPAARTDPETIVRIGVPSTTATTGVVTLGSVADLIDAQGPSQIDRFGRQRQVVIYANLEGKDLASAVEELTAYLKSLQLPPEYQFQFLGDVKRMNESDANFAIGFLLAFIFMYMILAAQFESLIHPLSILSALPLTIPFAVLSLILFRADLDIFALLGVFMLFGIVKKNGIMQVDCANQLRAAGMPRDQAVLEANRLRLRPILMTTVMLVAAMVPMALSEGPGANTRASMAKVILGGQAFSLLLTLLVTPVAYSLLDELGLYWQSGHRWLWRKF